MRRDFMDALQLGSHCGVSLAGGSGLMVNCVVLFGRTFQLEHRNLVEQGTAFAREVVM